MQGKLLARMVERLRGVWSRVCKLPWLLAFAFDRSIGREYGVGARQKLRLIRTFHRNAKQVATLSSVAEHLELAAELLRLPREVPGDVVECGCYRGGSTVSLSLVCAMTGRHLIVCDSFEGLPPIEGESRTHVFQRREIVEQYEEGQFAASLETVRDNLARFGDLGVCEFRVGYFHESMPGLEGQVAMAFLDVDLVESLKPCLEAIWPRLGEGGKVYVHEAEDLSLVATFFDGPWWRQALASEAPGFVGAGTGLPLAALEGSELGYAEKR